MNFFTLPASLLLLSSVSALASIPSNYNSLSIQERQEALWNEVQFTAYSLSRLPTQTPGPGSLFDINFLATSFNRQSDFLPTGRKKLIHTFGSVAKVRWIPSLPATKRTTGVFAEGGVGVLRLSQATQSGSFTPGCGLKILTAGGPSVNIMVMPSLDGQGSDANPFRLPHNSKLTPPNALPLKILGRFFEAALGLVPGRPESPLALPLDEFAAVIPETGARVTNWVAPTMIRLVPAANLTRLYDSLPKSADLRFNLASLSNQVGPTQLFTIQARMTTSEEWETVGELRSESPWTASAFGDEGLFFQHPRHVKR
jgi:hypothetical protein